jgi:hypothetical protein
VRALLALLVWFAPAAAQTTQPASTWREPGRNPSLYPAAGQNFDIANLQLSLFLSRCYGNQLKRTQVDGRIGPLTRKAIDVFVEEYKARYPRDRQLASPKDLAETARQLATASSETGFCETSRFRPLYFASSDEHMAWTPKHQKLYPSPDDVWQMKTLLLSNGCYGDVSDTTTTEHDQDFGSYSRRALHVFVEEYHLRNPTRPRLEKRQDVLKAAAQTVEADIALGQPLSFCTQSTFMEVYFPNPAQVFGDASKCAFPRSSNKWLASLGTGNASFRLGNAMKELDEAYKTYFNEVKEPDPVKAGRLGIYDEMKAARSKFFLDMRTLRETRDKLSRYGALLNDETCFRCLLLVDYDSLLTIASPPINGRRYLAAKAPGATAPRPPNAPVTRAEPPPNSMDVALLDFELLANSHRKIQKWRVSQAEFERRKQSLSAATDVSVVAYEFVQSAKDAEEARVAMLSSLWDDWVKRKAVPEGNVVAEFAEQRDALCGGEIGSR